MNEITSMAGIAILLLIHVILCISVYVLKKLQIIKTTTLLMPTVILMPVIGIILLLLVEYLERKDKMGYVENDVDLLKVQEVRYQRIEGTENQESETAVPLEEALMINDTNTRRKLMLDILHKNPDEYIDLLQRTRTEGDVEITHYATTTMMKLQTEYEQKLQQLHNRRMLNPKNLSVLKAYEKELQKYINSGLITENILRMYRDTLKEILAALIRENPEHKRYYFSQIDNLLELGRMEEAEQEIAVTKEKWPQDERVYMAMVKFFFLQKDGEAIQNVLHIVEENHVYLSHKGKDWYRFWKHGEIENE